ncbi:MAG: hypothetical protein CMC36_00440 [Flavobacteriaceae bacterium]|nr:hypothetical protein [Flavobacteriaceae bacterium]
MTQVLKKSNNLQILISTKGKKDLSFLYKMFKNCNLIDYSILVVDQSESEKDLSTISEKFDIKYYNIQANGLSNSRNFAISKSSGDICLLCDDDVVYEKDFYKIIINSFYQNDSDVITYYAKNNNSSLFKNYPSVTNHNYKSISYINSFLIAFKREKIFANNIKFDPLFGLGAVFETADEYIFLRNILEKNLSIISCPKVILTHPTESSGQDAGIDKNIFARAAIFYKFYGYLSYVKLIHHIFLLKKKNMIYFYEIIPKFLVGIKGIKKFKSLK